jgi:hypothetical protein
VIRGADTGPHPLLGDDQTLRAQHRERVTDRGGADLVLCAECPVTLIARLDRPPVVSPDRGPLCC